MSLTSQIGTPAKGYNESKFQSLFEQFRRWNPSNGTWRVSIREPIQSNLRDNLANALTSQGSGGNFPPGTSHKGYGGGGGGFGENKHPGPLELCQVAAAASEVVLTLASFAVTKIAYVRLTKDFREKYLKETGVDVRFKLTFGGSGVQARAVCDGLPADIVALALPLDVDKIASVGLITPAWRPRFPNRSVVCDTTVALVVRKGNPKNIRTWEDLTREGVEVVLANPKTAGVARWIFLALWGYRMKEGDAAAAAYVQRVFENVITQPRDAREASDVFFKQKVGDVLLTYENEVILTNEIYGENALPYTVPEDNIRIECPVSPVDKVLETKDEASGKAAVAFINHLFSDAGQREFAQVGFRINPAISKVVADSQTHMPRAKLWTVDDELGGWAKAQEKFFDPNAILDQLQITVGRIKMEQRNRRK